MKKLDPGYYLRGLDDIDIDNLRASRITRQALPRLAYKAHGEII